MRIASVRWWNRERIAVHLFPYCLLNDGAANLHKVALRRGAFRHDPMMPRIRGRWEALWKSCEPTTSLPRQG